MARWAVCGFWRAYSVPGKDWNFRIYGNSHPRLLGLCVFNFPFCLFSATHVGRAPTVAPYIFLYAVERMAYFRPDGDRRLNFHINFSAFANNG